MFDKVTRAEMKTELIGLHRRFGRRLFGTMGQDCLNLYSNDWRNRDVGFLGRMTGQIEELRTKVNELIDEVDELKAAKKKKPTKKKKE